MCEARILPSHIMGPIDIIWSYYYCFTFITDIFTIIILILKSINIYWQLLFIKHCARKEDKIQTLLQNTLQSHRSHMYPDKYDRKVEKV